MANHPLTKALNSLNGERKLALDKAKFHDERADYYGTLVAQNREQAKLFSHDAVVIDKAIEAIVRTGGAVLTDDDAPPRPEPDTPEPDTPEEPTEVPAEEPEPFSSLVEHEPPASAPWSPQRVANGSVIFDRLAIRRVLRFNRMHYPVSRSNTQPSQFIKQFMIAAAVRHPGYEKAVKAGGPDLLDIYARSMADVNRMADLLQLDRPSIEHDARALHDMIFTFGEPDVDYRTKVNRRSQQP